MLLWFFLSQYQIESLKDGNKDFIVSLVYGIEKKIYYLISEKV